MSEVSSGRRHIVVTVIALLLMLAGGFPWTALSAEGTPETVAPAVTVAIDPTATAEPTEVPQTAVTAEPTTAPVAPTGESFDTADTATDSTDESTAPVEAIAITLACETRGPQLAGVLATTDPSVASSVSLELRTTDDPAISALQTISVDVTPGQTSYTFTADLEAGDFEASKTAKVRVISADGLVVSDEVGIASEGGATVCVPEGSSAQPTADSTVDATATATSTATETAAPTATAGPAISTGTVINTGGANLRCRAEANTSAGIVTLLPAGFTVAVRGAASDGWVPVTCAGQDGWVSGAYLLVTTSPAGTSTPASTVEPGGQGVATVVNTGGSNLRCRTSPTTLSSIVTLLPAGFTVAVRGAAADGWVPVTCGGQDGFVSAAYVSISSGGTTTPTATATTTATATATTPGTGSTAYVTGTGGAGLRCRTSPVSGDVILVLPENQQVSIQAQSNGWGQVACGGQTGWVSLSYILFAVNLGSGQGALRIDINLSSQYMIVYQGTNVLARTYVSTGRPGFDTPTGTFYINTKVKVQDMQGVLGGEYYHVRDVPDVMYFTNRGHAFHGAYWHNNFGYVMSHGCVNLPLGFATWLYSITPIGTKVTIHY